MIGIAAQFGFSVPASEGEEAWISLDVLRSRNLARKMLSHKFDSNAYGKDKALFDILTDGIDKKAFSKQELETLAIDKFENMFTVSENKKLQFLI